MKKALIILILSIFSITCLAQSVPIYAEFVGGLNIDNVKFCSTKMQAMCSEELQAVTQNKENIQGQDEVSIQGDVSKEALIFSYATCMYQKMQNEQTCIQSLVLLNKLKPKFVEVVNIQSYPLYDTVETKVNKDDAQKWYFIVNNRGEFIDTRDVFADMKNSTTYPYFIRKYPNATLGDAISSFPPRFEKLPLGDTRLVFARVIVNKINDCKSCEIIGTMESGYDFKSNGEFKWVKFIKLIPNEPLPL